MSDPRRILVLEDDPIQRGVFERILRTGLFQVKTIHDPVELVTKLDVLPVPDAILLDILLPGMDGMTVMQHLELNARWCVVPVIMTTASPTRDRVIAANQLPVPPEALLIKPVDPQAMIQLLQAVIAGHEPLYLMRSLQRQRLSLRLSLQASLSELEVIGRDAAENPAEAESRHVELRRQIQTLRGAEMQLRDAPPETLQIIRDQIQKLEDCSVRYRRQMSWAENRRKLLAMKRGDILRRQRSIRELEQRIQALSVVLKQKDPPKPPPARVELPSLEEALAQPARPAPGSDPGSRPQDPDEGTAATADDLRMLGTLFPDTNESGDTQEAA